MSPKGTYSDLELTHPLTIIRDRTGPRTFPLLRHSSF